MFDPNKPRILVALGGRSPERKVSVESGNQVILALEKLGYQTAILDTGTGRLMQSPELDRLELDPEKLPEVVNLPLVDIKRHFQLVFIAIHGKFGEDGGLQALLDNISMPYTGSKPLPSALGMDKKHAKAIFNYVDLPVLKHQVLHSSEEKTNLKFPLVVKPNDQGSSVGVSICENEADLKVALKNAFKYSEEVMLEPYMHGRELTVAILENDKGEGEALPVVEIIPTHKFFDFEAKYDGTTQEIVPAKIPAALTKQARDLAIRAHNALGCRHFSRVDMVNDDKGKLHILEINTIPGLTPQSLFPRTAATAGYPFEKLIDHLVKIALKDR